MDHKFKSLLPRLGGAIVLRMIGAGCAFLLSVTIGRLLGAEGAGLYFLSLSLVSIASIGSLLGLDNAALRFVSAEKAHGNMGRVGGVLRLAGKAALLASLSAAALLWIGAKPLAIYVFDSPELTGPLRWMSFATVSFTMMMLLAESIKGLQRIRDAMLVSSVIYPIVAVAAVWPLVRLMGPSGAALAFVLGTLAAALYGAWVWRAAMRDSGPTEDFDAGLLARTAVPLWAMALIRRGLLPWAPLFLVGVFGTLQDAGILGAALRVVNIVALLLSAVNSVIAPKFSELFALGDLKNLERLAQRFTLLVVLATSPILIILILFSSEVMLLFGEDFANGGTVLAILALGQGVNVACGAVGYMLMMTGHEKDARNSAFVGLFVLAVTTVLLVPANPLIGSAIAVALAMASINLYALLMVYKRLDIVLLPIRRRRG